MTPYKVPNSSVLYEKQFGNYFAFYISQWILWVLFYFYHGSCFTFCLNFHLFKGLLKTVDLAQIVVEKEAHSMADYLTHTKLIQRIQANIFYLTFNIIEYLTVFHS